MLLFLLFTTFNFIFMYFDFHYAMRICGPLNLLKKKQGETECRDEQGIHIVLWVLVAHIIWFYLISSHFLLRVFISGWF